MPLITYDDLERARERAEGKHMTTDDLENLAHDAPHEAHECDCSVHNAMELYLLVSALAAEKGIDLDDPHDVGDGDDDHAMDLRLIADLAIAHGAEPGELDDEPDDDGDESGEFDVSRFSDDDTDTDDLDDPDTDEIDVIDLDGIGDDEDDESFSDGSPRVDDADQSNNVACFTIDFSGWSAVSD